ncbi:hypothetical protein [Hoeflea alexandrii]|uniref:hypothetical protein n=1 Tax=Hoeflea alexandrii TaxID=288436 RepID=UPI0022B00688|nr:hypothetical protein [Hoeflea alexandrii]MCZ4288147.1 hypothetical protein [Hoeflea alexandrii]
MEIKSAFYDLINNIREEAIGYTIALILGYVVTVLFLRVPRYFKYVRRKAYIRWSESYFPNDTDTIILDIAGADQDEYNSNGFEYDYKSIRDSGQVFRLKFPGHVVDEFQDNSVSFSLEDFNTSNDEVFGKSEISELERITEISDIRERISRACEIEAKLFYFKEKGRNFNGKGFGLRSINFDRIGNLESPKIDISLYRTDYFTQCVMSRVALELLEEGVISSDGVKYNDEDGFGIINRKYFPLIPGLAINAFVFTDEGREITLVRRSANANSSLDHAGKFDSSIDEAFSQFDVTHSVYGRGSVTISNCFRRGADEELGIKPEDPMLGELIVYQVFFVKSLFQVALAGYCKYDATFEEMRSLTGKDKPLEHKDMISVQFNSRNMSEFIMRGDIIPCIRDILIDLCRLKGLKIDLTYGKGFYGMCKYLFIYIKTFFEFAYRR